MCSLPPAHHSTVDCWPFNFLHTLMISAVHMSEEIEAHTNTIIGKNIFEYWLTFKYTTICPTSSLHVCWSYNSTCGICPWNCIAIELTHQACKHSVWHHQSKCPQFWEVLKGANWSTLYVHLNKLLSSAHTRWAKTNRMHKMRATDTYTE